MRHKLICLFILALGTFQGWGQQTIIQPSKRVANSFAVFTDIKTYNNCKESIDAYKNQLESEGLSTYILIADWEGPEHVKFFIEKYYREQALEGAVFIGDIPIPMVRRAQFLTSAFKMDESLPMIESSVPCDRFYDDFGLKFEFISKDSTRNFYYYNLSGKGDQIINCNIYTGRIKPTKTGKEGYKQISDYLNKAVAEHKSGNILDNICSYTGEGSFSNSLSAWKDERITLEEQIPSAFCNSNNAKFFMFYMYPSMKETIAKELKREEVDLFLFHEHGMPYRQYLTGEPAAYTDDENFSAGKLRARQLLRRSLVMKEDTAAFKKSCIEKYMINNSWFSGAFDKKIIAADSILDLKQGIIIEDVDTIMPNPRFVIFDACYNGDFREQKNIASEYIFANGKSIAAFANSVNVLQDKSSSDLLGLLYCGARVGEWAKNVNILESHIIGDPTFRFTPAQKLPEIKYNSKDTTYWLAVLSHNLPTDLKGLALHKLFNIKYEGISQLLLDVYKKSSSYMLRLQAMHLLAYYNDGNYNELLKCSINDSYEFIRRKGAFYMGQSGRNEFIPYLVKLYLNDYLSERVAFNILRCSGMVNAYLFKNELEKQLKKADFAFDKEKFLSNATKAIDSNGSMADFSIERINARDKSDKARLSFLTGIKNNPYPAAADDLLIIASDSNESIEMRRSVVETLGWYTHSYKREYIVSTCRNLLAKDNITDKGLTDELQKTINRLETFMR